MEQWTPKVFISYSHDSPDHANRVGDHRRDPARPPQPCLGRARSRLVAFGRSGAARPRRDSAPLIGPARNRIFIVGGGLREKLALETRFLESAKMTGKQFSKMDASAKAKWLNRVSPTSKWALGDDVFCLHCDAVFKAEDVACDEEGDPTCPICHSSTPLDFHYLPWWREDLCKSVDTDEQHAWKVEPIHATPGQPHRIPKPDEAAGVSFST